MKRISLTAPILIVIILLSACAPAAALEPSPAAPSSTPAALPSAATPAAPTAVARPTRTPAPTPGPLPVVEVTGTGDLINGDRASAEAFIANPGPDGMGLREALDLANRASGPTVIKFAPSMAGQTIKLGGDLMVRRDGITIEGLLDPEGQPAVTILGASTGRGGIRIMASHVVIRNLHLAGLQGGGVRSGIYLEATDTILVSDILIEGNLLEGAGDNSSDAISLRDDTVPGMMKTTIRDVVIKGNTLKDFSADCDGIHIGSRGDFGLRENILIAGNTFLNDKFPVELEASNPNNTIRNVRILNNRFEKSHQPISIGSMGEVGKDMSGALMTDTVISGNMFESNDGTAIAIVGGFLGDAPRGSLTGNTVKNTRIMHNVFRGNQKGIFIFGGFAGADENLVTDTLIEGNLFQGNLQNAIGLVGGDRAKGNSIRGVMIANNILFDQKENDIELCAGSKEGSGNSLQSVTITGNTLVASPGGRFTSGIRACEGSPENVLSELKISSTILWGHSMDVQGLDPDAIGFSIIGQGGLTGGNHNLAANPQFVNAAAGDFHLTSGSPAIDAGDPQGAPAQDYECSARAGAPDIGAFEFNGAAAKCASEEED